MTEKYILRNIYDNFIKITQLYSNNNIGCSKEMISKYYYPNIRNDLMDLWLKFNDARIIESNAYDLVISSTDFDKVKISNTNKISNTILAQVEDKVNNENWVDLYTKTLEVFASKLTHEESDYFVNYFFKRKSEETIADEMNIALHALYNIKKSCLVKMIIIFDKFLHKTKNSV